MSTCLVPATAGTARKLPRAHSLLVVAGIGLLAGGCSSQLELRPGPADGRTGAELRRGDQPAAHANSRASCRRPREYWGKAYAKNPRDAQAAINYAKNLKALGEKQQALAVLQQASVYHGGTAASTPNTAGWPWSSIR